MMDKGIDKDEQLTLKEVSGYVEAKISMGQATYNGRSILVKSTDPLVICGERGILEEYHVATGQQLRHMREVAQVATCGRRAEEMQGGAGGGLCYMTLVNRVRRKLCGNDWARISMLCFAGRDIDGRYYFTETEYSMIMHLAPAYQKSFDELDKTIIEQLETMKKELENVEAN